MKKHLEYKDSVSNKFWEINLKGKKVQITYGRIGIKNPAVQVKTFNSNEEAKNTLSKKSEKRLTKDTLKLIKI